MDLAQPAYLSHGPPVLGDTAAQVFQARLEGLSKRERQIADRLVAGKAHKAIASELNLSPRTVEIYRSNIMARMEADTLIDLVRMIVLAKRMREGLAE